MAGSARTFNPNAKSPLELREQLQRLALMLPLSVYDWTGAAPGLTDDITQGYKVGSRIFVGANAVYRAIPGNEGAPAHVIFNCSSNAEGAAVWQEMSGTNSTAGSGGSADGGDPLVGTDYLGVHNVSNGLNERATIGQLIAAGGAVTSVTGTAPIASTGGATPAISLNDAGVTLAKMANLAQDQFIGRVTASTGVPETATITAAARTILDDTTVQAAMNTISAVAAATNEHVLTKDTATGNAIFKAAAGGSSLPVVDTTAIVKGSVTASKEGGFDVDANVPVATKVDLTFPAAPGTIVTGATGAVDNTMLVADGTAGTATPKVKVPAEGDTQFGTTGAIVALVGQADQTLDLGNGTTPKRIRDGWIARDLYKTAGLSAVNTKVGGALYKSVTDVTTSGTTETDLWNQSIAASVLATDGESLHFMFGGQITSSAFTCRLRVYFPTGTVIYDSTAQVMGTTDWLLEGWIIRTAATTARCITKLNTGSANLFTFCQYVALTGLTLTNANVLRVTGQMGTTGGTQIAFRLGKIYYEAAA